MRILIDHNFNVSVLMSQSTHVINNGSVTSVEMTTDEAIDTSGSMETTTEVETSPEMETTTEVETSPEMEITTDTETNVDAETTTDMETTTGEGVDMDGVESNAGEDVNLDGAESGMDTGVNMDGFEDGMYGETTGSTVKDPLLSSWPFVIGTSVATFALAVVIGFLLAKKKIKKGYDIYED